MSASFSWGLTWVYKGREDGKKEGNKKGREEGREGEGREEVIWKYWRTHRIGQDHQTKIQEKMEIERSGATTFSLRIFANFRGFLKPPGYSETKFDRDGLIKPAYLCLEARGAVRMNHRWTSPHCDHGSAFNHLSPWNWVKITPDWLGPQEPQRSKQKSSLVQRTRMKLDKGIIRQMKLRVGHKQTSITGTLNMSVLNRRKLISCGMI